MSDVKRLKEVKLLKALANQRRLEMLRYMMAKERAVSELETLLGISQSAVSQHLAGLRKIGIVVARREAQNVFYKVEDKKIIMLLNLLDGMF